MRLAAARREVKLYLIAPDRFSPIHGDPAGKAPSPMSAQNTADLLRELRGTIFQSRRGDCYSAEQLEQLYAESATDALPGPHLTHLVSCPDCLERVNQILGFPPLADRLPTEMLGPDTRPPQGPDSGDSSGMGGGDAEDSNLDLKEESRQRAQEVFRHRPQELRIAVNGFILGSQKIDHALTERSVELSCSDTVNFVEVFSEDEKRLLLLPVSDWPSEDQTELAAKVVLSHDRTLELKLSYLDSQPQIQLVYSDPLLQGEIESLFEYEFEEEAPTAALIKEKGNTPASTPDVESNTVGPVSPAVFREEYSVAASGLGAMIGSAIKRGRIWARLLGTRRGGDAIPPSTLSVSSEGFRTLPRFRPAFAVTLLALFVFFGVL